MLMDSGSFGCESATYNVNKVWAKAFDPYAKLESGMYGFGPNSCVDYADRWNTWHSLEEGSFTEAAQEASEDIAESAQDGEIEVSDEE